VRMRVEAERLTQTSLRGAGGAELHCRLKPAASCAYGLSATVACASLNKQIK
jgi:hypothetical protein